MTEPGDLVPRRTHPDADDRLDRIVGDKAARKARSRHKRKTSVWYGLSMYGVVGWSIALPTLIGIAVGLLLDTILPLGFSWALTMLFAGLVVGLHSAWPWVSQEMKEDEIDPSDDKE